VTIVFALGVVLLYAMRPPSILASGQPDPFTVGTAILLVGYFLFPVLGLLAAVLLLVALLLVAAHLVESRRARGIVGNPAGNDTDGQRGIRELLQDSRSQALLVPLGAAFLASFYLAFMALRAGDTMHIDVTALSTAFAFCAGLAIAAGLAVVLLLHEGALGARFGLAIGLLVFALLAMFSIGLVILPIALLLLGFAVRQLAGRRSGQAVRAALAGAIIGVGAVAYLLVLIQPAAAECRANGGGATSSGGLFGSTAVSQGGSSLPNGGSSGYIDEGDDIAYFTCREGKLADFHREALPAGTWLVATDPSATVGRNMTVVFRLRPAAGASVPADGFDFSVTCRTCSEPRPIVRAHANRLGARAPGTPGAAVTFAGQVVFPAAGSWFTSPYDGAIEVR